MNEPQIETFHCNCHTPTHHMFVTYDPEDNDVYVELKLNQYLPWWERLWIACKYVFGNTASTHTQYEDIILSHPDREKLAKMLLTNLPKKEPKNVRTRKSNPNATSK